MMFQTQTRYLSTILLRQRSPFLQPHQPARRFVRMAAPLTTSASAAAGPIYRSMEAKLTEALSPESLVIRDDSAKHAHHAAMRGSSAVESHFAVTIVSAAFAGKTLIQRHQLVYKILDEELKVKGVHALQIHAKTPEEITRAGGKQ
ncbi:hypothetical protein DFJ73DRAFT_870504, partial [Zopfochytrium polystomum]